MYLQETSILKREIFIYQKLLPATSLLSSLFCKLRARGSIECKIIKHLLGILKCSPSLGHCQRKKNRLEVENSFHYCHVLLVTALILDRKDIIQNFEKIIFFLFSKIFFKKLKQKQKNPTKPNKQNQQSKNNKKNPQTLCVIPKENL